MRKSGGEPPSRFGQLVEQDPDALSEHLFNMVRQGSLESVLTFCSTKIEDLPHKLPAPIKSTSLAALRSTNYHPYASTAYSI